MLPSAASRRDPDAHCCRDVAAETDASERLRSVRERLEATESGLGELEFLRQRQEVLVRAALERSREAELSSEEKLLEENILLLRKQLNCLRRRDTGLISQLQELDRQICDLRLDTETSHEQPETDSRPSSGFYELSDAASGSLSNSSNSVFSECFCSTADVDGRVPTKDELASCLECDGLLGGLCDDSSSSGTVSRSLSAPHPPTLDPISSVASCDSQLKYHCDLVVRNVSDVFRYPSPLHAVAVQSPVFLQTLGHGGHIGEEEPLRSTEAGETSPPPASLSAPLIPQSSSGLMPSSSSSQTSSHKRLDSYIYSLLQRRALPIRTNKPRTSVNTDPTKSILRQASLCVRQGSGSCLGSLRGSELKPCWMTEGASVEDPPTSSPQRQWSVESKSEEQETQNICPSGDVEMMQTSIKMNNSDSSQNQNSSSFNNGIKTDCFVMSKDVHTNSLLKKKSKGQLPPSAGSTMTQPDDFRELGSPRAKSSPKGTKQASFLPDQELLIKSPSTIKTQATNLKNITKPLQTSQTEKGERSLPEPASLGSYSQSQDEGGRGGTQLFTHRQNIQLFKGGCKTVKVKTSQVSEFSKSASDRRGDKSHHKSSSRKSRLPEDGGSTHNKVSRRVAGGAPGVPFRIKRLPASIPEGRVLDKHTTTTLSSVRSGASRHHHGNHHYHSGNYHRHHQQQQHGRDQVVVVTKPKHKRSDYRRLRAIMEVPYDEAFRRARLRQRKELLSHSTAKVHPPSGGQMSSPYSYTGGSDSEYSAECASLFHSTIVDTSEDEKSNYTTNCFGDSESSEEEYMEESTTTSDTEESGGGGMSMGWRQLGVPGARAVGQELTLAQAKAFVKIKASRNLKKKILRFRSGSLKLMTTV